MSKNSMAPLLLIGGAAALLLLTKKKGDESTSGNLNLQASSAGKPKRVAKERGITF